MSTDMLRRLTNCRLLLLLLVTPYYCRLGDMLCFVFMSAYCMFDLSVYYLFLQYFHTVCWVFCPIKTVSHITYRPTVLARSRGDVKHCSI